MSHWICANEAAKLSAIVGSATMTMLALRAKHVVDSDRAASAPQCGRGSRAAVPPASPAFVSAVGDIVPFANPACRAEC